jgi:Ca-activated chloride channel family protein
MNDWQQLEFAHPWVLTGLLLLPALAWWLGRPRPIPTLTVPSIQRLANLARPVRQDRGLFRLLWLILPLALLLIGLARPRLPRGDTPDPSKGIDIMLTLDFSRSMAEEDFRLDGKRVSRREALEHVTGQFVEGRPQDRIGIVCFARSPFLVSPLTLDHAWAMNSLKETDLATGTGIGWAVLASVNFLERESDRSKVIILITDGENSSGPRPGDVISAAVTQGIRMYSVLIGPDVVPPSAAANHDLNRSARATGGQFFQATDSRAMERIYQQIDQLEKKILVEKRFILWRELHPWCLGAGTGLWLIGLLWQEVFRRRLS